LQTLIVSDLLENIEKNILQKQLANANFSFKLQGTLQGEY
jgi:hypothetical protein